MKISYDPKADAVYLTLKGHGVDHTVRISADVAIDYGPDGEIHGIEILSARRLLKISRKHPQVELEQLEAVLR